MNGSIPLNKQWGIWEQQLVSRLDEFGISRLADTTGMDTPGVPTASATKPATSDVIWVYSGKGRNQSQARVTAIMECLERSGSLWPKKKRWVLETPKALRRSHEVWGPDRFTYRPREGIGDNDLQVWVEAIKLTGDRKRVMIPADMCFNGRRPVGLPASPFLLSTSNGLAAAFRLEDALTHGLAEVIERDIISFAEVRASHLGFRFLATIANRFGIASPALERYEDNVELAVTVEPENLPATSQEIVRCYEAAGLSLVLKMLPNEFDLPAYGVAAIQEVDFTRHLGCAGYAVRASSAAALESALLELAQTRATDLQGAREDRDEPEKHRLYSVPKGHWLATPGLHSSAYQERTADPGLASLINRCANAGLSDVAYVEFPGWSGISVVRVIVPDSETWHITGGWSRLGPRLRAVASGS